MTFHVIGCGSIGRRHIRNLLTLGATGITVEDTNHEAEETVMADLGVMRGHRWKSDATLICAPAQEHASLIQQCIARRQPFFVEKPATTSVSSLAQDWYTTVPHLVGCNMIFRPEVEKLMAEVEVAAWMGELLSVSLWCESDITTWPGKYTAPPVFEFCHEIDIALRLDPHGLSLESFHKSSEMVTLTMRGVSRAIDVKVHLGWSRGVVSSRGARCATPYGEIGWSWSKAPEDVNQMYLDEMWHFVSVVRRAEPSKNTLARARRVVEICEEVSK